MARMHAAKSRRRDRARAILAVFDLCVPWGRFWLASVLLDASTPIEPHSVSQPSAPLRIVQSSATVRFTRCDHFYGT